MNYHPTHLNCAYLFKQGSYYVCYDSRSKNHGKKLNFEQVNTIACENFHLKKEKENNINDNRKFQKV